VTVVVGNVGLTCRDALGSVGESREGLVLLRTFCGLAGERAPTAPNPRQILTNQHAQAHSCAEDWPASIKAAYAEAHSR
jgi:hypothetical protein